MDLIPPRPYERLPDNHIRLLHLDPGTFEDPISVTLSVHPLTALPEYDALSYVWGTEKSPNRALVNGCPLEITENLDLALRYLRQESGCRVLWVDALAIDQGYLEERNHQVQLMRSIYSLAARVLVWLGPAAGQSDLVMSYVNNGNEIAEEDLMPFAFATMNLLKRPWFWRVWVIQEVTFASQDPIVLCGTDKTTLSLLTSKITTICDAETLETWPRRWLESHMLTTSSSSFLRSFSILLVEARRLSVLSLRVKHFATIIHGTKKSQSVPISFLMSHTLHFLATDPRDKIYGLFGMYEMNEGAKSKVLPDYSKSIGRVFTEVMEVMIREGSVHGYGIWPLHTKFRHELDDIPSWVPDLRTANDFSRQGEDVKSEWACYSDTYFDPGWIPQQLEPLVQFSIDKGILHVAGAERGRILHLQHFGVRKSSVFEETAQKMPNILSFFHTHSIPVAEGVRCMVPPDNRALSEEDQQTLIRCLLEGQLLELNRSMQIQIQHMMWRKTFFVTDTGHWGATTDNAQEGDLLVLLFGANIPFILRQIPGGGFHMIEAAKIGSDGWKREYPTAEELDWNTDFAQYGLKKFDIY